VDRLTQSEVQALKKADVDHFLHPSSSITKLLEKGPKISTSGKGCKIYDVEGKEYYDGIGGLWLSALGHGNSELAEVAKQQMETLEYWTKFNEFSNVPTIKLATRVAEMVPIDNARIFFSSGGSETNDTVFKIARYYFHSKGYKSKERIISRQKAYHGTTYGALSATKLPNFHEGFEPLLPGFSYIETPYCYLCPFGKEYPNCKLECATALEGKILELGPDNVAAFVAEPIMGTGGVFVPPAGYFNSIREICDRYEVLYIDDEVICGFGRTGRKFGIDHWDVKPDMICMAKAITSGYIQLGAAAVSEKIFDVLKFRGTLPHGYTYSGHPVACAVGLKNLEIIERERLWENAAAMGERLMKGLRSQDLKVIGEVRGKGLMVGVDLVKNRETKEKFATSLGARVVEIAFEKGLLTRCLAGDILQFSPPMIVKPEEVDRIVEIAAAAIQQAYEEFTSAGTPGAGR
jgi:putrescine aminotransferase